MRELVTLLLHDETGQGTTEYAMVIGTLAFGAIVMFLTMSSRWQNVFNFVGIQVNQVPTS